MTLSKIGALVICVALVGYIGFNIQRLLVAPVLTLMAPEQGLTTSSATVQVRGKTTQGAEVRINGSLLPPSRNGEFRHQLTLAKGVQTITVEARKRYSRPATLERQVFILGSDKISDITTNYKSGYQYTNL